jgi:hypothetical protein
VDLVQDQCYLPIYPDGQIECLFSTASVACACVLAATMLCAVLSWKTLMWASPPRTRMLSRVYKASTLLGLLALIGSAWLLYVLRHSAPPHGDEHAPWSTRSRLVLTQAIAIPYIGLAAMLWCWANAHANDARQHCTRAIGRILLLWLPAGSWTLVAAVTSEDRGLLDGLPLWCQLGGLSLALLGFLSEVLWFVNLRLEGQIEAARAAGAGDVHTRARMRMQQRRAKLRIVMALSVIVSPPLLWFGNASVLGGGR